MHLVTTGIGSINISVYKGNVHYQHEIFRLIVALKVDKRQSLTTGSTITFLTIFNYTFDYENTQREIATGTWPLFILSYSFG